MVVAVRVDVQGRGDADGPRERRRPIQVEKSGDKQDPGRDPVLLPLRGHSGPPEGTTSFSVFPSVTESEGRGKSFEDTSPEPRRTIFTG